MENRESLERTLKRAQRALEILEEEAAGFGRLHVPVDVQIELEEKHKEVTDLESRLAQLSGQPSKAVPDNLPRQDIFIGRKKEIEQCLAALDPADRSWGVVIDGIGGMGKTALALEVAQRARKDAMFAAYLFVSAKTNRMTIDGVRQETLAATSLDAFVREFARLLGELEISRMPDASERREALLDAMRGRRVLLVWDNLETLTAEERKQIGDFLLKLPAPNKAIITSRFRAGESGFPIRLDRLVELDAFALMDEIGRRYSRVSSEVQLAGVAARRTLYQAVGGSPLVLNLTLGFIAQKGWSFRQILNYVRDPERSKDLYTFLFADALKEISENEGAVLSALSTMQTPAEPSFLVEVTRRTDGEVEIALEQLVRLSLVNDLDGGRFILHPLTRAYLQTALASQGEHEQELRNVTVLDMSIKRNVLIYWVDYARRYNRQNPAHFRSLEIAWADLEATASSLYLLADIPTLLKERTSPSSNHSNEFLKTAKEAARMLVDLAGALYHFWNWGYWDEFMLLNEWAYEAAKALGDWQNAGWRADGVVWIHCLRGEGGLGKTLYWARLMKEAVEQTGDPVDQAKVLRRFGTIAEGLNNLEEARSYYLKALDSFQHLNVEFEEAATFNDLGRIYRAKRDYVRAEWYHLKALEIYKKLTHKDGQASVASNLGAVMLDLKQIREARSWEENALKLAQEVGRQDLIARARSGLARVLEQEGHYSEALIHAAEALNIQERLRNKDVEATRQLVLRLRQRTQTGRK